MTTDESEDFPWFAVRCVFLALPGGTYEERVTLWRAVSADDAIAQAESEAGEYTSDLNMEYVGFAESYELADDPTVSGAEVFSLMRDSDLSPDEYVNRFFDTGAERRTDVE
jgi:hypothetical protein